MRELIERLEKATKADRELDLAVEIALRPHSDLAVTARNRRGFDGRAGVTWDFWGHEQQFVYEVRDASGDCYRNGGYPLPHFTSSIDAALTLVPEGMMVALAGPWQYASHHARAGELIWDAAIDDTLASMDCEGLCDDDSIPSGKGFTPAIAVCIAALKARAAFPNGERE